MSHFGSRVIGAKKAAEEATVQETRADHFGPRVIGDVLAARRLAARKDEGAVSADSRSDPAVKQAKKAASQAKSEDTVAKKAEVVEHEAQQQAKREEAAEQRADADIKTIEAPTTTNLEELKAALDGNPAFYEALYDAEFRRAGGPRRAAMRMFLVFEMENQDREDRKTAIEVALNSGG